MTFFFFLHFLQIEPVFVLGCASFVELLRPYACLSYISSTATVRPLIYGCLSPAPNPLPLSPNSNRWSLAVYSGTKTLSNSLNKYDKQEVYGEGVCDCSVLIAGENLSYFERCVTSHAFQCKLLFLIGFSIKHTCATIFSY